MNRTLVAALGLWLGSIGQPCAQGYAGPQSGYYVYGPDHEYHLLSRNQPFMQLRPPCNPQWDPYCNVMPYPVQPLLVPPPPIRRMLAPP